MTLQEIELELGRYQFKGLLKTVQLSVRQEHMPFEQANCVFTASIVVPDAYKADTKTTIYLGWSLPVYQIQRDTVASTVTHLVKMLVLHELDEGLLYDGKHVNDPHPERKHMKRAV